MQHIHEILWGFFWGRFDGLAARAEAVGLGKQTTVASRALFKQLTVWKGGILKRMQTLSDESRVTNHTE